MNILLLKGPEATLTVVEENKLKIIVCLVKFEFSGKEKPVRYNIWCKFLIF